MKMIPSPVLFLGMQCCMAPTAVSSPREVRVELDAIHDVLITAHDALSVETLSFGYAGNLVLLLPCSSGGVCVRERKGLGKDKSISRFMGSTSTSRAKYRYEGQAPLPWFMVHGSPDLAAM